MDEAIHSLASSHGVTLTVDRTYHVPRDEHGNPKDWVFTVRGAKAVGPAAACADLHARLVNTLSPPPARQIEGWLAELSVIVARRPDDEFTETLRVEAYAGRLSRYPADIVRDVLLGKTWRFWPSWAELEPLCEAATAGRKAMLSALAERARQGCPEAPHEPQPVDYEARRKAAAEILRQAGFARMAG